MTDTDGDLTSEGRRWLGTCLRAAYNNCITLAASRSNEDDLMHCNEAFK
jgi:hypothetical protein